MPATLPTNQQHQSTEGILHQQFTTTITDIHFCITQFQFYDSALSLHLLDKWPASPELTKQSSKKNLMHLKLTKNLLNPLNALKITKDLLVPSYKSHHIP